MDKIKKLLQENNLQKVFKNISKDKHISDQYGPLNKSKETQIFEEVIHNIIQDYENNTKNITFLKKNGKIILNSKNQSINLKDLLDNVNFNHLSISKADIEKYATNRKINASPLSYEEFQQRIKKTDVLQETSLSVLNYGEMIAINKYTGVHYKTMSLLLRNTDSIQVNQVASTMLNIAIASHGLNKLPDMDLPQVIRNQDEYNLNQLIENAEGQKVSQEKSFISTTLSSNVKINTESNRKNVKIIYKNVRGKSISAISQRPDELEYLLPPSTQIRWTGYKNTSAGYVFTAEGANVVINEPSLPAFKASEAIIHAAENLEQKVDTQVSHNEKPVMVKTKISKVISDQQTKIPSEELTQLNNIEPVLSDNNLKLPSLHLNKITIPQEISNSAIEKSRDDTSKVDTKIPSGIEEIINKLNSKDTVSSLVKPPLPLKPINNLNLHHQTSVLNTNENNNLESTIGSSNKVQQELEQFGKEIIDISVENNLITEQHKERYLEINSDNKESKFSNDVKETAKEKISFKDKMYNLAKRISKSLGLVSMSFYFDKKINDKNKFKGKITRIQTDLKNKKKSMEHKLAGKKSSNIWYR